jgi:hypothetical protein
MVRGIVTLRGERRRACVRLQDGRGEVLVQIYEMGEQR